MPAINSPQTPQKHTVISTIVITEAIQREEQLSPPFSSPLFMVLLGMTLLSTPLTPLPRIGRCASPVAMEPQLDMNAALACAFSLSPVVLGLHWGSEWNEARDRVSRARKTFEMERLRLMCGEGEAHAQHITSTPLHR